MQEKCLYCRWNAKVILMITPDGKGIPITQSTPLSEIPLNPIIPKNLNFTTQIPFIPPIQAPANIPNSQPTAKTISQPFLEVVSCLR